MPFRDFNPTQGFRPPKEYLEQDWPSEETQWRERWRSRPYVSADLGFEYYRPAYRYGYESAHRHRGSRWEEVESDLRSGWERYEHRGQTAWESVKEAVRDAWNRVANR